jgi:hypothetical protein
MCLDMLHGGGKRKRGEVAWDPGAHILCAGSHLTCHICRQRMWAPKHVSMLTCSALRPATLTLLLLALAHPLLAHPLPILLLCTLPTCALATLCTHHSSRSYACAQVLACSTSALSCTFACQCTFAHPRAFAHIQFCTSNMLCILVVSCCTTSHFARPS